MTEILEGLPAFQYKKLLMFRLMPGVSRQFCF